jgi:porphobilinogen deaminase
MRERIAEIATRASELAEIQDAWILARIKQLADCSIANFLLFDARGHLVLDDRGHLLPAA